MKCPRCKSDHARLNWLREFSVTYWCPTCHECFDVGRHLSHPAPVVRSEHSVAMNATPVNGVASLPSAS